MKEHWYATINRKDFEVIESLDSAGKRIWVKFEPVDKSKPIEVANILDQPNKVSWEFKNSHFETIDQHGKRNYHPAVSAGSISLPAGTTVISKDRRCKVLLFPLESGVTLSISGNTIDTTQFTVNVNKPTCVGFVTSGGTINPI